MKIPKKRKYISLPPEYKREIAADLGCSIDTIDNALNYRSEGDQPDRIRKRAKEMGGVDAVKTIWVTQF